MTKMSALLLFFTFLIRRWTGYFFSKGMASLLFTLEILDLKYGLLLCIADCGHVVDMGFLGACEFSRGLLRRLCPS